MLTAMPDRCGEPLPSRAFGPPFSPSDALGVAHFGCLTAASVNVVPECRPLSVEYAAAPLAFASFAVAVGQSFPTCSESGRAFFACVASLALPERQSRAVGVAHAGACDTSDVAPFCELPYCSAVGVGYSPRSHVEPPRDDEEPLSPMGRSNVGSS